MILLPIGPTALNLDLKQFIGWVAPSSVYIYIVLNHIITKLQFFIFFMKITINKVPLNDNLI